MVYERITFPDNEQLVSITNNQGVITYCKEMFARVAGFTVDELVGKNHKIVRHPDMPPRALQRNVRPPLEG